MRQTCGLRPLPSPFACHLAFPAELRSPAGPIAASVEVLLGEAFSLDSFRSIHVQRVANWDPPVEGHRYAGSRAWINGVDMKMRLRRVSGIADLCNCLTLHNGSARRNAIATLQHVGNREVYIAAINSK